MAEESIQIGLDLATTSVDTLAVFMDETADDNVFAEIIDANSGRLEVIRLLYEHPYTPDEVRARAASVLSMPVLNTEQVDKIREKKRQEFEQEPQEQRAQKLVQKVERFSISEKIKLAAKGGTEIRKALIRDSNKMVVMGVLDNPRITEPEVENLARSRSAMEDALRVIAKNREWTKSYSIQIALVKNPKTPPGLAMPFVHSLKKRDLVQLEKNKNVSEGVRSVAKKMLKKGPGK